MSVVQECEPARFVLIAVPTHTFMVAASTMASILGGCLALSAMGVRIGIERVEGCAYVAHARNHLVKRFLAGPATDLLFVDYDIGFEPEAVVRVTQARYPVVAGAYPMKTEEESWPVGFAAAGEVEEDADGLVGPSLVTTGFLRLNRAVFVDFNCEEYIYEGESYKEFFRCGPFQSGTRREFVGEDIDFCRRWELLGGRIRMVPDLTFTHTGVKTWTGNWADSFKTKE